MREIRRRAQTEELDYLFLMDCLSNYKQPRAKLTTLLKNQELIRIKKGLYVFGSSYRERPYSLEVLANLIYGPSYVSFEYALAYYNLIPESVLRVTSASYKRAKHFETAAGEFVYYYVAPSLFPLGITLASIDENSHFLIATKEKALADCLARLKPFGTTNELLLYLTEGMRMDALSDLQLPLIEEIRDVHQTKNLKLLCQILKK